MPLDNTIIVVNDEPYCIWDVDLRGRNNEFLDGIDADYFEYLLDVYLSADERKDTKEKDEKRASIAVRMAYHHALETLFLLLGAYAQAPDCAYAWVSKCSNRELREFLGRVNRRDSTLFTKLKVNSISWESFANLVFMFYLPDTQRGEITRKLFAGLWTRLAGEYLEEDHRDEYNSLKHGFRAKAGGFALKFGAEHQYGVPPPDNEMKLMGHSEFGTAFLKLEPVDESPGNRSLRTGRVSLNWKVEKVMLQLQLIHMSILNVKGALKIANGAKPSECKFVRPTEDSDFEKPWTYSTGVTRFKMEFVMDPAEVVPTTRKQLLEKLKDLTKS